MKIEQYYDNSSLSGERETVYLVEFNSTVNTKSKRSLGQPGVGSER